MSISIDIKISVASVSEQVIGIIILNCGWLPTFHEVNDKFQLVVSESKD